MFFQIYIFLSILENVLLVPIMNPYWIIKWTPPLPPAIPGVTCIFNEFYPIGKW